MLVHVTRLLHIPAELGIFCSLAENDCVVLSSEGVYNLPAIQSALPDLTVFAIDSDIAARGLSAHNSLSMTDWVSMQSKHQQWVTI